ncbi:Signal transduction response regulator [Labilithrix luteola]|uniref:Signal transduction response regulator n=1 Tax=Labilithrix luteola TaxID=1391654 RepID=A0A0K1Q6U6_9BACT|nr:hypothetical protein [Labilithrix luteola]AKV01439.1 Signal transduction response regulator [Labilithrix luteola]
MQRGIVGRTRELAAMEAHIAEGERLLTVFGPAGIGKTAFAREVARRFVEGTAGGTDRARAWACDLEHARDAADVEDAVARAIGAEGPAVIGEALGVRGPSLVVLDACEHVGTGLARLAMWLEAAPEAIFVLTSRRRDVVPGVVVELEPLVEGAELFRVFAARSGARLNDGDAPYIDAICMELGNVPLAIELAAARVAVLGARALLHRLKTRFEVLRRPTAATGPARHTSLEAAIDASWEALTAHEQGALAQSSVFHGGFALEAAESVIVIDAEPSAPPVLDVLSSLRDRALLSSRPSTVAGEARLSLDANVRAYAARKLGSGVLAAEERHAQYYATTADAWARALDGADGAVARLRVLADKDNILAVTRRVRREGPVGVRTAEPALRALVALAPVLLAAGPFEAYAQVLEPVLHATRSSGADPRLVARVLLVRATIARLRGTPRAAAEDLVRALGMARAVGDLRIEARALTEIGVALEARGDLAGAEEHHGLAMNLARRADDGVEEGAIARRLGVLVARRGRCDEGTALLERALSLHQATNAAWTVAEDHRALAALAIDRGAVERARSHVEEALRDSREANDVRGEALAMELAGLLAHDAGDLEVAARSYGEALERLQELGARHLEAALLVRLGAVARERGRAAEAWTLLRTASSRLRDDPAASALLAAHVAALEAAAGRPDDARVSIGQAAEGIVEGGDVVASSFLAVARATLEGRAPLVENAAELDVLARRSADLRIFLRGGRAAPRVVEPPPEPSTLEAALVVGEGGLWFRVPNGERVSLERRRSLALLLDRLLAARLEHPGVAIASEALQRAAWPGERIVPSAGAHRLRVAVATLRKLGLRELVETTPTGYRLSGDVPCVRA